MNLENNILLNKKHIKKVTLSYNKSYLKKDKSWKIK